MQIDAKNLAFGVRHNSTESGYQKFVRKITYDKEKYRTVLIPESLFEKIEEIVDFDESSYVSVSEFVKEVIRNRLREMGYKI